MACEVKIIDVGKEEIIETPSIKSLGSNAMSHFDAREFKHKNLIQVKNVEEEGFKFQILITIDNNK